MPRKRASRPARGNATHGYVNNGDGSLRGSVFPGRRCSLKVCTEGWLISSLEVAGFFDALLGTLHDYDHLSELASRLELLYNTYSYDSQIYRKEALLRDALYVGCCMHLIPVCREKVNVKGRPDLEISLNGERVVFEFKVASTPDRVAAKLSEASQQMEERSYGEELPEARLTRYSIVVCSATRKVAAITARQGDEILGRYLA